MGRSAFDIHLVCGCTGAGKTTYSTKLARDLEGIRFSIDEWMEGLHNQDKPEQITFEWFYDRVQRNGRMMRKMAEQSVRLDVPAVFDCGFTNKHERDIFVNWAEENGFTTQIHYVDVPATTRWQRVQNRNTEQSETFQFEVTREMFDFIESIWEAPSSQEIAELNGVRITD